MVAVFWAGLLGWHGWLTLTLFGPDEPYRHLLDGQPVISGRHPLHLYHGMLGARALFARWDSCCYDPTYQAGYPKTPLFDSGSRPAEVFAAIGGGGYNPAGYKIGLAVCCFFLPLLMVVAARESGFRRGGLALAATLGLLVWWSSPCRNVLELGDVHLLIASQLAVLRVAFLVSFDRARGLRCWLGLVGCGALGWLVHPYLTLGLAVIDLLFYLVAGPRHSFRWHLALLSALLGGPALNSPWLLEWLDHWWIITPRMLTASLLPHRTLHTVWDAALWGDPVDRGLGMGLLVAASVGLIAWAVRNQRTKAYLFGVGALGACLLALAGLIWEPASRLSTNRLFVLGLWFAVLPATHAVGGIVALLRGASGRRPRAARGLLLALGTAVALIPLTRIGGLFGGEFWSRFTSARPFRLGLGPDRLAAIDSLRSRTRPTCRVLWEDQIVAPDEPRWTPLLGPLCGRSFIGGLDPDGVLEHAYPSLVGQVLAERPIGEWTDAELDEFCRRYNIGWVVCRSPATAARFEAWSAAWHTGSMPDADGPCRRAELYTLHPGSYFLKGSGRVVRADSERITLADVVPEHGRVVLSFHYQAGMTVTPPSVVLEREPDANDPIPFIRLRTTGPVSRITLRWSTR